MRSDRLFTTIDFHTAGIGMRLLTAGTAYITGTSQFLFDPDDPLREGFLL